MNDKITENIASFLRLRSHLGLEGLGIGHVCSQTLFKSNLCMCLLFWSSSMSSTYCDIIMIVSRKSMF